MWESSNKTPRECQSETRCRSPLNIWKKLSIGYFEGQVVFCFVDKPGKTMKMDSKDPVSLSALKGTSGKWNYNRDYKEKG